MKRLLALLVTASLLFSLTACGGKTVPDDTTPAGSETTVAPEDTTAAPEPLPTSDIFVCGKDLAQYRAVAYFNYGAASAMNAFEQHFDDSCLHALGFTIPYTVTTTFSAISSAVEESDGKVILFLTNARSLEGFPVLDGGTPSYGVTDNGSIYLNTGECLLYTYLWDAFLLEAFGACRNSDAPVASASLTSFPQKAPALCTEEFLSGMGYTTVFDDNFNGDTLSDAWETRGSGVREGGYISASQATVADGILTLTGEYLTDGEFGEGYYTSFLRPKERFCRGYFEARIQCNPTGVGDFWSAFWLQAPNSYNPALSQGGPGGAEIDIIEHGWDVSMCNIYTAGGKNPESTALDADHMKYPLEDHTVLQQDFHTYGFLWDETGYIFMLDGVAYFCRDFYNGTSAVPQEVILSVCIPGALPVGRKTNPAEMKVDYLKIWQIPAEN